MSDDAQVNLLVQVCGIDAEDMEKAARQLRAELLDNNDVLAVHDLETDETAPEGAKGLPPESLCAGILIVEASMKTLASLFSFLDQYSKRGHGRRLSASMEVDGRKITVEYDPDKDTPKDVKKMMEEILKIKSR